MDPESSTGYKDPSIEAEARRFNDEQRKMREEAGLTTRESDLVETPENLGVPEGEGKNPRIEKTQSPDFGEVANAEMRESREQFVKNFIEDSIAHMESEWGTYLDGSVNGEKARAVIAQQTEAAVMQKAEQFIENVGVPDFDFEAELQLSTYDTEQGRQQQFVTDFRINVGGVSAEVESGEGKDKPLTTPEQAQGLGEAAEEGELKERTV